MTTPDTVTIPVELLRRLAISGAEEDVQAFIDLLPAEPRQPFTIPQGVRYFLDADGFGWREIQDNGYGHGVCHSMIPTNPANTPTPEPYLWLVPETPGERSVPIGRIEAALHHCARPGVPMPDIAKAMHAFLFPADS